MNQSASPSLEGSPIRIAQQETAQHIGDIVARAPQGSSGMGKADAAAVLPAVDARPAAAAESHSDDAALMSEWSIRFDGRRYLCCGHRYGRLADAIGYARLVRARQLPEHGSQAAGVDERFEPPSAADRRLMAAYSISFGAGVYEFSGYHYDHLRDALNYARLMERAQGRSPRKEHE